MTFRELRRRDAPPTPADVAQAIRDELAELTVEYFKGDPAAWPNDKGAARRLSVDVCRELHNGPYDRDFRDVLRLMRRGDEETTLAVNGYDRDAEIDRVAYQFVALAETIAAEWRSNMRGAA